MKTLFLSLLFLLFSPQAALAQSDSEPEAENGETEALDLFDGDAEETRFGWNQLSLGVGYMPLDADGTFKVGLPSGREIMILDLDRLGVDDDDTSFWFSLMWRSRSSRWGAWFGAWRYDASGYRIWEDELQIGDDLLVPAGAGVHTDLATDWYIAEATYSFVRTEKLDVGIGFGFHVVDLDAKLTGKVTIGDHEREIYNESLEYIAPLPNVLGYAYWRFADRWRLISRYGWFGLSYDKYDGRMLNLHALLRYEMSERWAVEGGYQFVKLDLDINEDNYTAIYDIDFYGPMLSLRFDF